MNAPEPTVALVFSPEAWVEALHRHLSHHGGARVRQIVVEPAVALDEEYDVLVVSDRWPALTFGFVRAVHGRGRRILGVFDPDEVAGKDHLVELGADATIASDADAVEFVAVLRELGPEAALDDHAEGAGSVTDDDGVAPSGSVVAVCGPRGSGVTEIALGLAVALAEQRRSVVLLDAHESAPAVAGRLGLGLEPNLRTAIDACAHGLGTIGASIVPVVGPRSGRLGALPGHPSSIAAAQVTTQDVLDVVVGVRRGNERVVVDLEERTVTARAVVDAAEALVGVVSASPVGVVRALEWVADEIGRSSRVPLHLVVNRAPSSRFRQEEIRAEVERTLRPASLSWCPHDPAVEVAAWDGTHVGRGGFRAACTRIAAAVDPESAPRRRVWAR